MNRKDWTLLVLASAGGAPVSPVQLQKALFLIERNLTPAQRGGGSFYKFRAYDYGPFDSAVYTDAEILDSAGLAKITNPHQPFRAYSATEAGIFEATHLRHSLGAEAVDYLDRVVKWVRSLSFNDLVQAIYAQYPKMRANSVFRG